MGNVTEIKKHNPDPMGLALKAKIEVSTKALDLAGMLDTVQVTDEPSHLRAGQAALIAKTLLKKIHDDFEKPRQMAHDLKTTILAMRDEQADPLDRAYRAMLKRDGAWIMAEEAKRVALERRRIEQQEAEAELQRLIDVEAAKQADDTEAVEELKTAPIVVPLDTTPIAAPIEHVEGMGIVRDYDFVIVTESEVPRQFCSPDPKKIRATVVAMRDATRIPGVRVFPRVTHRVSA